MLVISDTQSKADVAAACPSGAIIGLLTFMISPRVVQFKRLTLYTTAWLHLAIFASRTLYCCGTTAT